MVFIMNDFFKRIKVNNTTAKTRKDITGEIGEELAEQRILEAQLEDSIKRWEEMNQINIITERKLVEEIVKKYKKIINLGLEYDEKDYEKQKKRLATLLDKEREYKYRQEEDPSWEEMKGEELLEERED